MPGQGYSPGQPPTPEEVTPLPRSREVAMVVTALERVVKESGTLLQGKRFGLLYHQASIDRFFRGAPECLAEALPGRLAALFGPQHGVWGTEQDNMKETPHSFHEDLGIPIYSLYSSTRAPAAEMVANLDAVLVDLQDVGTRVYTYATTVLNTMTTCADANVPVVILDRPNPVNGIDVEGNLLQPAFASFVGPYPLPMRHGLTLGELMTLYNEVHGVGCSLEVIPMAGYSRTAFFEETGLPWVPPSPNMPLVETAIVYPGQVILEGTNLSEGRGTTRPFEVFGSPYMNPREIRARLEPGTSDGAILREIEYRPAFNAWTGEICRGFQIHVTDRRTYRPYRTTLALLAAVMAAHPGEFVWSEPPYEYVFDKLPIDVILGDDTIRRDLEAGRSVLDMEREWAGELEEFLKIRNRFLLYSL